jgi:4a-hydroxytetrahydrobiopterin dehydratase
MTHQWTQRPRPTRLERRVEFPDYEATRRFLEGAEASCKEAGIYPDISFGRTYVNLTLHAESDSLGDPLHRLAAELDALIPAVVSASAPTQSSQP